MQFGGGGISYVPNQTPPTVVPPPGPPFIAGSANNGLRVEPVGGVIQLGGPLPGGAVLIEQDTIVTLQAAIPNQRFGFIYDTNNANQFLISENIGHLLFTIASADGAQFDTAINLSPNSIDISGNDIVGARSGILSVNSTSLLFHTNPDKWLEIDPINNYQAMGDITNFLFPVMECGQTFVGNNFVDFYVPDPAGTAENAYFEVKHSNNFPVITSWLEGPTHRSRVIHDEDRLRFEMFTGGPIRKFLDLFFAAGTYAVGDIDSFGNNNFLLIDDNANRFIISNAANNTVINMNSVDGFTGTVTPVTSITVNGGIVTAVS